MTLSSVFLLNKSDFAVTAKFTDQTTWEWTDKITSLKDLYKKKGTCIAVDVKKAGDKKIITAIKVLAPYKVPEDVVFLDVREKSEISSDPAMTLLGALNIPLTELEDKAKTLDKTKKET